MKYIYPSISYIRKYGLEKLFFTQALYMGTTYYDIKQVKVKRHHNVTYIYMIYVFIWFTWRDDNYL